MKKSPLFINCQLRNVSTDPLKHQNNDSTPLTPANMLQLLHSKDILASVSLKMTADV